MPNIILIQNEYPDEAARTKVINYICRSGLVGAYGLNADYARRHFEMVFKHFHKTEGLLLQHFVITFTTQEAYRLDVEDILRIGFQVGKLFAQYQMVYAVHLDARYIHLHILMSRVSFIDGTKYSDGLAGFWRLKAMLQQQFPKSDVGIYHSYPDSEHNTYKDTSEDYLLRIG